MGAMAVRVRMTITGRVQGVFFRDSCQQTARRLGVNGWVRNRADGSVEVAAEGDDGAVGALAAWCREGPPRADVVDMRITYEEPEGLDGFRVTR